MAKWEQWLRDDIKRKEKFHSKFHDEFDDRQRGKKARRKTRPGRSLQEDYYPFD